MKRKTGIAVFIAAVLLAIGLTACGQNSSGTGSSTTSESSESTASTKSTTTTNTSTITKSTEKADIEAALNLTNMGAEWTYSEDANAWTLSPVIAVANPEIADEEGVSVCVPGAYVKGVDTTGDGAADTTSGTATGTLIIDHDASITSTNGQVYTADTAPVIVNTGAAGYSEQSNQTASSTYAGEGYINVACGNRGKQSTTTDASGNTVYTGDAPCCLVDQKNVVRFVKFNILLGNLPGSVNHFVSTGGSGGGAHAAMLAATSNNPDFYDYEAAVGAVGVYANGNGGYNTTVTVGGSEVELSDGLWGCMAYSAITSLAEADMALAFEYHLNPNYSFSSNFQAQTADYLATEYMSYINGKGLTVDESKLGFDLDGDGNSNGTVALTIERDADAYAETNGYHGTYLDLYLAEFKESLQGYLDRLPYASDWTWFDKSGNALSDSDVAAMSASDKAQAFVEGRYAKGSTSSSSGGMGAGPGGAPGGMSSGSAPSGSGPGNSGSSSSETVGTPDSGTTQSANGSTDSSNYSSFSEMLAAYQSDIASVQAGDAYGNNIVELYDPTRYIGAEGTANPTWARVLMGASEGDISMLNSLNLEIAWLNAGTDASIEWQWDGGHVPSEILGDSLPLYVDTMYGKHVDGAAKVSKAAASAQTSNGTETSATGTNLSSWVIYDATNGASFSLAGAAAYRTAGASKATPGFDVIDYGQEDYVFGNSTADARHWDKYVLKVFEENQKTLEPLFNAS